MPNERKDRAAEKPSLEKTMDQAEGEEETVDEALKQRENKPSEPRHQRG